MNILELLRRHKPNCLAKKSRSQRTEVILSGSGGQGLILAGKILAEAVSIYDGKEAVMTQSYGPEARGGASRAEVIISSESIDYPKVIKPDVLLAMTQQSLDKYGSLLSPDGLLIIDSTFIKDVPAHFKNVFKAPFSATAIKVLEHPIVANVVALGTLCAVTNVVTRESLIKAVLARVPKKVLVIDRIAVDAGYKLARDSKFQWEKKLK